MAQQPPQEPPESIVLQVFEGLKNTVAPSRLGPTDLERAINIDLDDAGMPRRRRGVMQKQSGDYHSLQNIGDLAFGVKDGALGTINPDYSHTSIVTGIGPQRVAMIEQAGWVYWSNTRVAGKINLETMTNTGWGVQVSAGQWISPVVAPTDNLSPIAGRLFGRPPLAAHLAARHGRLYLAFENFIWATELYLPDYVDKTRNFLQFEDKITGMASLDQGMYVGTESAVYFLTGVFGKMQRSIVARTGMLEGSLARINANLIKPSLEQKNTLKDGLLFMTQDGVIGAFDNGVCYNLTQDKFQFPDAVSAAAMVRQQDGMVQYVSVLDSGGTPSSNTRIGDYVDAEIVRRYPAKPDPNAPIE